MKNCIEYGTSVPGFCIHLLSEHGVMPGDNRANVSLAMGKEIVTGALGLCLAPQRGGCDHGCTDIEVVTVINPPLSDSAVLPLLGPVAVRFKPISPIEPVSADAPGPGAEASVLTGEL